MKIQESLTKKKQQTNKRSQFTEAQLYPLAIGQ
jgi:hypothetical protein